MSVHVKLPHVFLIIELLYGILEVFGSVHILFLFFTIYSQ